MNTYVFRDWALTNLDKFSEALSNHEEFINRATKTELEEIVNHLKQEKEYLSEIHSKCWRKSREDFELLEKRMVKTMIINCAENLVDYLLAETQRTLNNLIESEKMLEQLKRIEG